MCTTGEFFWKMSRTCSKTGATSLRNSRKEFVIPLSFGPSSEQIRLKLELFRVFFWSFESSVTNCIIPSHCSRIRFMAGPRLNHLTSVCCWKFEGTSSNSVCTFLKSSRLAALYLNSEWRSKYSWNLPFITIYYIITIMHYFIENSNFKS